MIKLLLLGSCVSTLLIANEHQHRIDFIEKEEHTQTVIDEINENLLFKEPNFFEKYFVKLDIQDVKQFILYGGAGKIREGIFSGDHLGLYVKAAISKMSVDDLMTFISDKYAPRRLHMLNALAKRQ